MEIENLLVSGLRLRCAHEAAFFSAGVIPDEEILEDRSVFWENGSDPSGVPNEQAKAETDTGDEVSTSGRFTGNLSLSTCPWPPLHAWVGALLILLFENGLDEGYLDRRDRPPLKVILSPKAVKLLEDSAAGISRFSVTPGHICALCPYLSWCTRDNGHSQEE